MSQTDTADGFWVRGLFLHCCNLKVQLLAPVVSAAKTSPHRLWGAGERQCLGRAPTRPLVRDPHWAGRLCVPGSVASLQSLPLSCFSLGSSRQSSLSEVCLQICVRFASGRAGRRP